MVRKIKEIISEQNIEGERVPFSTETSVDMSSEEMLQRIEATQPELLGNKKSKSLTKKELKELENEQIRKSFSLELWDGDSVHQVALSQLVQLDATPIKNARLAMREINKEHLSHLKQAYENGVVFPPIKVQYSTMGFIVVDGYHRWQVYIEAIVDSLGETSNEEELQNALNNAPVEVHEVNVLDEKELIKCSFAANLAHGLAATSNSRSRYAMWLIEDALEHGEKLSIHKAAKIANVSHVAVIKTMAREKKRAEKQGKMIDAYAALSEEDKTEIEETAYHEEEVESHTRLESAITSFYKSMATIHKELESEFANPSYEEDIVRFFRDNNKNVSKDIIEQFAGVLMETIKA